MSINLRPIICLAPATSALPLQPPTGAFRRLIKTKLDDDDDDDDDRRKKADWAGQRVWRGNGPWAMSPRLDVSRLSRAEPNNEPESGESLG